MELPRPPNHLESRTSVAHWKRDHREAIVGTRPIPDTTTVTDTTNSPFTPYCGLKLVELAQKFFPPGVVQSLSGDDKLGPWLTSQPGIDKISFTGSTATGKLVLQSASKTLKRVTLELYVNDPRMARNVSITIEQGR